MPAACSVIANLMSVLRALVSRNKRRYREGGFDLDLSYIGMDQKIIAMGFPAEKVEGIFRNHIDEVFRFLETNHKDHYRIYNLCSERHYDHDRFHGRVAEFPFEDHNPPMIETIGPFCDDVNSWLSANQKHVVAIHCKAGKGRTGVMICAFLVHSRRAKSPEEALKMYAHYRTSDQKGVTIPSQRRYVEYYGHLVSVGPELYSPVRLNPTTIVLSPLPILNGSSSTLYFMIYQNTKQGLKTLFKSEPFEVKKTNQRFEFVFKQPLTLSGDVKFEFKSIEKITFKSSKSIFSFWFNTYFLTPTSINGSASSSSLPTHLSRNNFNPSVSPHMNSRQITNHHSTEPHPLDIPKVVTSLTQTKVNGVHASCTASDGSEGTCFWSENRDRRTLSLKKDDLDRAHKDKNHKKFPRDFQVFVNFVPSLEILNSDNDSNSSISGGSDDMASCTKGPPSKAELLFPQRDVNMRRSFISPQSGSKTQLPSRDAQSLEGSSSDSDTDSGEDADVRM